MICVSKDMFERSSDKDSGASWDNMIEKSVVRYKSADIVKLIGEVILEKLSDYKGDCDKVKRDMSAFLSDYRFLVKAEEYQYEHENRLLIKFPEDSLTSNVQGSKFAQNHGLDVSQDYLHMKIPKRSFNYITVYLSPYWKIDCTCALEKVRDILVKCCPNAKIVVNRSSHFFCYNTMNVDAPND